MKIAEKNMTDLGTVFVRAEVLLGKVKDAKSSQPSPAKAPRVIIEAASSSKSAQYEEVSC